MFNNSIFHRFLNFLPPLLIFSIPLFYLDISVNPWSTPKLIFIVSLFLIGILLWTLGLATTGHLYSSKSALHLPLLLFTLAICTSLFLTPEGRIETMIGKGALLLSLTGLAYLLTLTQTKTSTVKASLWALIISGTIIAIHSILQLTLLHSFAFLPNFMQSRSFTLTGSPLSSIEMLILSMIASGMIANKEKTLFTKSFLIGTIIIQGAALAAYLALSLPGKELSLQLLPYSSAWSLTLDALKYGKTLLAGIGLSNFPYLFTQFKPLTLNSTPLWNSLPTSATSEILQLTITTGLFGLLTFLLLPLTLLLKRHVETSSERSILTTIMCASLALLILTPATIPLLTILFITYGLLSSSEPREVKIAKPANLIVSLVLAALIFTTGYWAVKVVRAEVYMKSAQTSLAKGDGKAVYDAHIKAIGLLPYLSSYHLSYSAVNMSLAASLSQKTDLSDTDKSTIAQLVSQGVREAKIATELHPSDARAWANLGGVYRNLINSTEGADQFATSAFSKAISLDAGNPSLRVEYGGLLYQLSEISKDETEKNALLTNSIQQFQTAVQLKSDYANAYYNLSKALEKAGNLTASYSAMERAVASLATDSPDLGSATSELAVLKGKLESAQKTKEVTPSPTPAPKTDLSEPSPLPSALPGNPIPLDEDSN